MTKYETLLFLIFWKNMKGTSLAILPIPCQSQHNSNIQDKNWQDNWLYVSSPFLVPPEHIDPQTMQKSWTLNPIHLTSRKVKCFLQ